jgi:hypothetical protein
MPRQKKKQKKLKRVPDLSWLSEKRVSSVTFAILTTIPDVEIEGKGNKNPSLIVR